MASDRVDYSAGHLRSVATDADRQRPGFLNNTLRRAGACFGVVVGRGSVPGGKLYLSGLVLCVSVKPLKSKFVKKSRDR